ncbi:vacuolar protein sorting-associated protein 9 [Phytophthora pseudosyringae]|uniref:Vacuolar protein sorting-associated protein 9 n=1 Tax=Phytophthora pseudosyringae TaxID=221518 RepID=A0A8T1W1H7_9STRA|nr:vacuolar protein sorting-associated protein 9 [Phytophthora pseudosyringae]
MLSSLNKRSRTRWTFPDAASEAERAGQEDGYPDELVADPSTALAVATSGPAVGCLLDPCAEQIAELEQAVAQVTAQAEALAARQRRRRTRRVSKNCRSLSKLGPTNAHFRRVQSSTPDCNQTQHRREILARQEMQRMRQQILALERRQSLLSALHLARRANAFQLVADKVHAYYQSFSRGYDPTRSNAWQTEALLRSMMLPNVQSPAFCDLDTFLVQWHNYSRYHAEITLHCEQIQPLESDDPDVYPVLCIGRSTLRISRDTIKHFFQPLLADEEMVQRLVGKTYDFPFVSRFHFNSSGRVFKLEPRAELASGLFDLVVDPFSTVRMLGASKLSEDGCLHAYSNHDATGSTTAAPSRQS